MSISVRLENDSAIFVTIQNSSAIKSCSYAKPFKRLNVTFLNGTTYEFDGISLTRFNKLVAAESPGKYFAKNIKGKYVSTKKDFSLLNASLKNFAKKF